MADTRISGLAAFSALDIDDDLLVGVDVSDTSMAASGTTKRFSPEVLLALRTTAPQLRLTTETGVPNSTNDRTSQGTLRAATCLPNGLYTGGVGFVTTWTGTRRRVQQVGNLGVSLAVTAAKNYDVFLKDSDLSLVLSSAWTDDTTRADAITYVEGLPVANADNTYLWLGTIRASGANVIEDSAAKRYVWNAHNRVRRPLLKSDSTSHTYDSATYRYFNADSSNNVECVLGEAQNAAIFLNGDATSGTGGSPSLPITALGYDWTSGFPDGALLYFGANRNAHFNALMKTIGLGYHYLALLESDALSLTSTFDSIKASVDLVI